MCDYVAGTCTVRLVFADLPRAITADGQAFIRANGAFDADHIAAMGSDVDFPTSLDGVHTFWMNVWSCPATRGSDDSGCVLINNLLNGYPDQVPVTLSDTVFPRVLSSTTLGVIGGTLDTPTSPLTALHLISASTNPANGVIVPDGHTLTLLIELSTVLTSLYSLRMDLNNITITPRLLGANGALANVSFHWADIAQCVTWFPKNRLLSCPTCQQIPACLNIAGCDALGVPQQCLAKLGTGRYTAFRIDVGYTAAFLSSTAPVTVPARRRLLSSSSGVDETYVYDTFGVDIVVASSDRGAVVPLDGSSSTGGESNSFELDGTSNPDNIFVPVFLGDLLATLLVYMVSYSVGSLF